MSVVEQLDDEEPIWDDLDHEGTPFEGLSWLEGNKPSRTQARIKKYGKREYSRGKSSGKKRKNKSRRSF